MILHSSDGPEVRDLGASSAQLIEQTYPMARVREMVGLPSSRNVAYVRAVAEQGWLGLFDPGWDDRGESFANRLAAGVAVAVERGRALQPFAFVAQSVVVHALASVGTGRHCSSLLSQLVAGDAIATWATGDVSGSWAPARGLDARPVPEGFVLRGACSIVHDAHLADWLLASAGTGGGISQFVVDLALPGVSITVLEGLDLTRTFCRVDFDDVVVPATALLGSLDGALGAVDRQLDVAAVLAVAETIGTMSQLFDATLGYAKERTAFGRPIGSFQAVKHALVDISLLLETSRALLDAAMRAVGDETPEASEIASIAKSYVGQAAVSLAHGCWQTYGGVAYMWDHDFHLYLRRLTTDAAMYGDPNAHNERICARHGF